MLPATNEGTCPDALTSGRPIAPWHTESPKAFEQATGPARAFVFLDDGREFVCGVESKSLRGSAVPNGKCCSQWGEAILGFTTSKASSPTRCTITSTCVGVDQGLDHRYLWCNLLLLITPAGRPIPHRMLTRQIKRSECRPASLLG